MTSWWTREDTDSTGTGRLVVSYEQFRSYFVQHTPDMLDRYDRFVAPAAALVDQAALARIGANWTLTAVAGPAYPHPTLIIAGRLDSTVGYATAVDLVQEYPHASVAVIDGAGHALPHEQPELLRALLAHWLTQVHKSYGQSAEELT